MADSKVTKEEIADPILGARFTEAVAYAVELHAEQARKGTRTPYVTHLFAVCSLVLEDGGTEDEAIAAILHDGPEDQGGQPILDEIRRRFGDVVADTVAGLSDDLPASPADKREWRERKEAYVAHLPTASDSVVRVSLADKLHNARSILVDRLISGDDVWTRFNAGRDEQAWYYGSLLGIFRVRLPKSRTLAELERVIEELFPER